MFYFLAEFRLKLQVHFTPPRLPPTLSQTNLFGDILMHEVNLVLNILEVRLTSELYPRPAGFGASRYALSHVVWHKDALTPVLRFPPVNHYKVGL